MAEYARDLFARTVASGWGSAVVGGAWTEALSNAATNVPAGANLGRVTLSGAVVGYAYERLAAAPTSSYTAAAMKFRIPNAITSQTTVQLHARLQTTQPVGSPTCYYAQVAVNADGSMLLSVGYLTAGTPTVLDTRTALQGYDFPSAPVLCLELEVWDQNPSSIRARVWYTAFPPGPADMWLMFQGDAGGPQLAGAYGLRVLRAAPAVATSWVVDVWGFWASDPPRPFFNATVQTPPPPNTYRFTSTGTTGDPATWEWRWGDATAYGTTAGPLTHVYAIPNWYNVTLNITTRWGTTWTYIDTVLAAYQPDPQGPMIPLVTIAGVDVCGQLYSANWNRGSDRWTDGLRGGTCTLQLRGRVDIAMGDPILIALPSALGGTKLWTGWADQTTYHVDRIDAQDTTMVTGIDLAAYLSRWHIQYGQALPEHALPARLADLQPATRVRYRQKYGSVPAGRWPTLRAKGWKTDVLRQKTYLDMIRDGMAASIAFGFVAADGAIVYGPWDAPSGVSSAPKVDLDGILDCPQSVELERRSISGIVNRWTVGDGDNVDRQAGGSIEKYGENAYTVPSGVLLTASDIPLTDGMFGAMPSPKRCPEATIPIMTPSQGAMTAEPMDLARWEGVLYAIMGVRHQVDLGVRWSVTLVLDRNPWAVKGVSPP